MKKKLFIAAIAVCAFAISASAQTNFQTFYDLGRKHFTTTLEGFHQDNWGNTFFFIDYDYNYREGNTVVSPNNTYFEIARCLNFWGDSALAPLSLQVEYNGGFGATSDLGFAFPVNSAFLFGVDYFLHSGDFKNTLNLKALYSGFADIWGENVINFMEDFSKSGKTVFISEPQLWYNIGQHMGIPNLHIGTEVELSYDFAGYAGFYARPCIGTKWVF